MLEFIEPRERHPRTDAGEPIADQRGVHEHAVLAHDVREMAVVDVERGTFLLETHPVPQDERGKPFACLAREGGRRVEAVADLGGVDTEQPHATDSRDINRVAVDHGANQHGIRACDACSDRWRLNGCNNGDKPSEQILHTLLLLALNCADRECAAARVSPGWVATRFHVSGARARFQSRRRD